jgi:hypothetical protein
MQAGPGKNPFRGGPSEVRPLQLVLLLLLASPHSIPVVHLVSATKSRVVAAEGAIIAGAGSVDGRQRHEGQVEVDESVVVLLILVSATANATPTSSPPPAASGAAGFSASSSWIS